MRFWKTLTALLLVFAPGCRLAAPAPSVAVRPVLPQYYQNPALFTVQQPEVLWENLVDVVDDVFHIHREQRVRQVGDVLIEGHITTYPLTGASILEPWRRDSVGTFNRLESTFQSIRRTAHVRVIPSAGGYQVEVRVDKELEDLERPEQALTGVASLRHDQSLDRVPGSLTEPPRRLGWIPQGRDTELEQAIIAKLFEKFAG